MLSRPEPTNPREAVEGVLQHGYADYIRSKYTDWSSREDDLVQLGVYASKFADLEDMLSELALMTNTEEQGGSEVEDMPRDRIILTSIHQAKGLEWSAVLMIWCCEGMIPLARALKRTGWRRRGTPPVLCCRNQGQGSIIPMLSPLRSEPEHGLPAAEPFPVYPGVDFRIPEKPGKALRSMADR